MLLRYATLPFFTVYHEDLKRNYIPSWLIFNKQSIIRCNYFAVIALFITFSRWLKQLESMIRADSWWFQLLWLHFGSVGNSPSFHSIVSDTSSVCLPRLSRLWVADRWPWQHSASTSLHADFGEQKPVESGDLKVFWPWSSCCLTHGEIHLILPSLWLLLG